MSAPTGIRRLYAVINELDRVHPLGHVEHTHYHGSRDECAACLIEVIREALDEYSAEPFDMDEIEPPCTCASDDWAGRVQVADDPTGRAMSVCTCTDHLVATQGYVQLVTGRPASDLIGFTAPATGTDGV